MSSYVSDLSKIVDMYEAIPQYKLHLQDSSEFYRVPFQSWGDDFLLRKGELTIVSGYSGHGKSDFVIHLGLHAISQGAKMFLASFELSVEDTTERLIQCSSGAVSPTDEFLDAFGLHYRNKLYLYDEVGQPNLEDLFQSCEWAHKEWGFDFFVFDNLMMMTAKEDDYNDQKEIVKRISKFAKDKKVVVLLVAHSKKPQTSRALNQQERTFFIPTQSDIKGCSSIGQLADNHISVTINPDKLIALQKLRSNCPLTESEEKELKRGCSIIKRDKKRKKGEFFTRFMFFDKKYNRLKDFESQNLKDYFSPFKKFDSKVDEFDDLV